MRDNSFGALRLLAALLVVYTHSFPIALGSAAHEPLIGLPFSLGTAGVFIFFAISGILVTKSFMQCESVIHFFVHRVLRIFPALIICVLLCALVLGPFVTQLSLAQYYLSPYMWSFLWTNMPLITNTQSTLPEAFVSNPLPYGVIDPIWTLPWELRAYILLAIGAAIFSIKRWPMAGLLLFALAGLNALFIMNVSIPSLFFLLFSLGGMLYLAKFRTGPAVVLAGILSILLVIMQGTPMFEVFFCGWIAVIIYLLGFSRIGKSRVLEKYDLSYGIYIYSFPVGQLIVFATGIDSPWLLFALNVAVAAVLAWLSWVYLEKPILARKHEIATRVAAIFPFRPMIRASE